MRPCAFEETVLIDQLELAAHGYRAFEIRTDSAETCQTALFRFGAVHRLRANRPDA